MGEQKDKNVKTEWSFSFEKLGQDIGDFFTNLSKQAEESLQNAQFSEPIGAATRARVRLDLSVGDNTIRTDAASDNLITADVTYVGEINFAASGDAEKVVNLGQVSTARDWFRNIVGWASNSQKLRWDITLTPRIPLDLDINGGVGRSRIDLSAVQPAGLHISSGTGELEVTLPNSATAYSARLDIGVGAVRVVVPMGATVDLDLRSGTGQVTLEIGDGAAVTARVRGGVGETQVHLPMAGAVMVDAKAGLGNLSIDSRIPRVVGPTQGDFMDRSGRWQTPDYEAAERKTTITFEGGVGALVVR